MSKMEGQMDSTQSAASASEWPWHARNLMPLLKEINRLAQHNTPPPDKNAPPLDDSLNRQKLAVGAMLNDFEVSDS